MVTLKLALLKSNNHLSDNGYKLDEQEEVFEYQLNELLANPRWYLDNLDYMVEYRVCWGNYRKNSPICPRKEKDL